MTELEKLYKKKQAERQEYLKDLAVYESKVEEAKKRILDFESAMRKSANNLRPDMRDKVLKVLERPEDAIVSREYFESLRKLYREFETIGMQILNGESKWEESNNENNY